MTRKATSLFLSMMIVPLALCCLSPRQARACIPIPDASGLTDMQSRRAVIWIKSQSFEMMFQNLYSGSSKNFAWVIPLPGAPTKVAQPSKGFVEQLDAYTSPMFEKQQCFVPCPKNWGRDASVASMPDAGVNPPQVTVWGTGQLGDLDYVLISSSKSADLIAWLKARSFNLPTTLTPLVDDYLKKGFVFFAAKVSTGAGISGVPIVKFTFDRAKTPITYPLRISAHGRKTHLKTLLWIISEDGTYLPKNYTSEAMTGGEHSEGSYLSALDKVMLKDAGRTFAIEYAGGASEWKRNQMLNLYGSSSVTEMMDLRNGTHYIVRLKAALHPLGTTHDLQPQKTASIKNVSGWYNIPCPGGVKHEQCDGGVPGTDSSTLPNKGGGDGSDGGCQIGQSSNAGPGSVVLTLTLLGLLGLRRRR